MNNKSYQELLSLPTFAERYAYAKFSGAQIGDPTFGAARFLNQQFYRSTQWRRIRDLVILRDQGCDLGHPDTPIFHQIHIHHLNPITEEDLLNGAPGLLDPHNLICVSLQTHNAIHYGHEPYLCPTLITRQPNDTILWKENS